MKKTIAEDLVDFLELCKVDSAFGVSGGFIVPLWQALTHSSRIKLFHCRHESGAAFSASEYSIAQNKPAVAFATAGPGITNALTGIKAARLDGSRLLFISAITAESWTGQWGLQETTEEEIEKLVGVSTPGYFEKVYFVSNVSDYLAARKDIIKRLNNASECCLGLFITTSAQKLTLEQASGHDIENANKPQTSICSELQRQAHFLAELINHQKVLLWAGFGARHAAEEFKKIALLTQSRVMTTPRGKGIFPESHPLYAGTSGLGSDAKVITAELDPKRHPVIVILGSRLGEFSASRAQDLLNNSEVYYIGLRCEELKSNLPVGTVYIESEISHFLGLLLSELTNKTKPERSATDIRHSDSSSETEEWLNNTPLHPRAVMQVIQNIAVNEFDCFLAAEAGNSFVWTNRYLKFEKPGRYRTSPGFGAMGHYASGLIGLAASKTRCAVGIIGDGSMLMCSEVSTAVRYKLPAIWLVMNDGCYNMCRQGLEMLGNDPLDCEIPITDFSLMAKAMGATGYIARERSELEEALIKALTTRLPTIIDVRIDRNAVPPLDDRIDSLRKL